MNREEFKKTVDNYETEFNKAKKQWTTFANEAPRKIKSLIVSGLTTTVNRADDLPTGTIGINLGFEANMDAAKDYLQKIPELVGQKAQKFGELIRDIDKTLDCAQYESVDEEDFNRLSSMLGNIVDYTDCLEIELMQGSTVRASSGEEAKKIKNKWNKQALDKANKAYCEKHGIDIKDIRIHKQYMSLKDEAGRAKTSSEMKKVIEKLVKIEDYLDSKVLKQQYEAKAAEFKIEEDLAKEKRRQELEVAFELAINNYKEANTISDYKRIITSLNAYKGESKIDNLITDCNNKIKEFERELKKEQDYKTAVELLEKNDILSFEKGFETLKSFGNYKDAEELVKKSEIKRAELIEEDKKEKQKQILELEKKRKNALIARGLASGSNGFAGFTAYVLQDGTVRVYGSEEMNNRVKKWEDIKAVTVVGNCGIVGLKWDGRCVYTVYNGKEKEYVLSAVTGWKDIVLITSNEYYCVGLDKDGKCHTTPYHVYSKQNHDNEHETIVKSWENVKDVVCSGLENAACIKTDGSVLASGYGTVSYNNNLFASAGSFNVAWVDSEGKISQTRVSQYVEELHVKKRSAKPLDLKVTNNNLGILYDDGVFCYGNQQYKDVIGINPSTMRLIYITSDGNLHIGNRTIKIFDDFSYYSDHEKAIALRKQNEAEEKARKEQQREEYRKQNVCQYCGGEFKKTLFGYKCTKCGEKKDY